jgi:hypothetical protein
LYSVSRHKETHGKTFLLPEKGIPEKGKRESFAVVSYLCWGAPGGLMLL